MTAFDGRVIVVSGACHPLGRSLVRRLAAFNALIVAIDPDAEALRFLAAEQPSRIEPLAISPEQGDTLRALAEAWGEEPVQAVIDLGLLCAECRQSLTPALAAVTELASALSGGLKAGQGTQVVALPDPDAEPITATISAAGAALVPELARALAPARLIGLRLPAEPAAWTERCLTSTGDLVLSLIHPVTRALRGGMVLDTRNLSGGDKTETRD